jgi:hypothetical protein
MGYSATWNASGTTVTFTTPSSHGLSAGTFVYISGTNQSTIDGYRTLATASGTTLTVTIDNTTASGTGATIAVQSDITEGMPIDLAVVAPTIETVSPNIVYDVVLNNIGFFAGITPETPYRRETAQYRKDQQDNSAEPGEQSLTGWWLRSQSSFHLGCGIKFYEPGQDEKLRFRFADSQNVDVWTQGQVSLLPEMKGDSTRTISSSTNTYMQTIKSGSSNAVLIWDGNNVYKVDEAGVSTTFIASTTIYGICNDGIYAYWCQNDGGAAKFYKKLLSANSSTAGTQFHAALGELASSGIMEWAKERVIACINNDIYELNPNAPTSGTTPPSAVTKVYENKSADIVYSSVTSSGSDIYISAYNGLNSFIFRLVLNTSGALVATLDGAVVAAEMPRGELIYSIKHYLGYLVIGTSFGVRVAQVLDGGDLVYGPLFVKTSQPVYGFACDDSFVWCASGVGFKAGLIRIDLSSQIDTLVFPWANDRMFDISNYHTTGVAFIGSTDKLAFTVALQKVYYEGTDKAASGYITSGFVRYNTLEKKIFKFISERAQYYGNSTLSISAITQEETETSIISKIYINANSDVNIPGDASEFIKFKFTLTRNPDSKTQGTVLYGYQVKSLPATPRQRLIQYPLYCFDTEMDRFNNRIGYDGQAVEKLSALESLESVGDVVTVMDNRSGETYSGLIEEVAYTSMTPPDRRFSGNGGMLQVTVRKI